MTVIVIDDNFFFLKLEFDIHSLSSNKKKQEKYGKLTYISKLNFK
jgi:hypothetical protein